MPVPTPTVAPEPRRLLRDVVFDKMLTAISDGTLELGERLNDDDLVAWLGVSRTPVREAIAKLADYGLVEIEANRYTRIIQPTEDEIEDTLRSSTELRAVIARRAVRVMTAAQRKEFAKLAKEVRATFAKDATAYPLEFQRIIAFLVAAAGSPALTRMEQTVGARAALMLRLLSGKAGWPDGDVFTDRLAEAVAAGDADAAFSVFDRAAFDDVDAYLARAKG
ncbi:GntR family transcriptional regulator [Frigoribacterium salinisoli]